MSLSLLNYIIYKTFKNIKIITRKLSNTAEKIQFIFINSLTDLHLSLYAKKKLTHVKKHLKTNKISYTQIEKKIQIKLPKIKNAKEATIDCPEIIFCKFSNVFVLPKSNLLLTKNECLYDYDTDFKKDKIPELETKTLIYKEKKILVNKQFKIKTVKTATSFNLFSSNNYAHFLLQILTRYNLIKNFINKKCHVIIDVPSHNNIHLLIKKVSKKKIIKYQHEDTVYFVKNYFYISPVCRMPWNFKSHIKNENFVFHPNPIKKLSKDLLEKTKLKRKRIKILIERESKNRPVLNFAQIKKILCKNGFKSLIIGTQKPNTQISFFRNAKKIVASAGAELANAIFCKPGTKIYILYGNNSELFHNFWRDVLSPLKLKTYNILGKNVNISKGKNKIVKMHAPFYINPELIKNIIKKPIEKPEKN